MTREAASVYINFIPAGQYFDTDDFYAYCIGDLVSYDPAAIYDEVEDGSLPDLVGFSFSPVGLQSGKDDDSSMLWYLLNCDGVEAICDEDTILQCIEIAKKLRQNDDPDVRFLAVFECETEEHFAEWYGVTEVDLVVRLTHYADLNMLEWIDVSGRNVQ
jgi:hypothetical protein